MKDSQVALGDPVQIGVCVEDVRRTADLLSSLVGIGPWKFGEWPLNDQPEIRSNHRGRPSDTWKARLAFAKFGNIEIELVENVTGDSTYEEFFRKKGPGLHHLMFVVDGVDETIGRLQEKGFTVSTSAAGTVPGSKWAVIDALDSLGFNIELMGKSGLR